MKREEKQPILLRVLALLLTAALLLGALVLVVYRDKFNLDALRRWMEYRDLKTGETGTVEPFSHAGGDRASFAYLDNGILAASQSGEWYYSFSGEQYAQQVISLERPVVHAAGDTGVVYDVGGDHLSVYRGIERVFQLENVKPGVEVLSARVNDSGWLALTAQESGFKGSVTVYDSSYEKEIIKVNLSSTFIVDAAISPDCKTVAVVTLGQSGGSFQSQVRFYHVNEREPYTVVSLGNGMPLDLDYEDGALWVLWESGLTVVDPNGGESSQYSFGRNYLKGCSLGGDGFAVVLLGRYREGSANQVVTVDAAGQELGSQTFNSGVLAVDGAGRYAGVLAGDTLSIFTRDFTPYSTLEDTQNARYLSMTETGAAVLANAQQVWMYLPG